MHTDVPARRTVAALAAALAAALVALSPAASPARAEQASDADLARATAALERDARVPGTAWGVDPATGQVLVSVDAGVTGAALARVTGAVRALGPVARLERLPGRLRLAVAGGQAVYGGRFRCSLGFNVRVGAAYAFLTAGHCTNASGTWYADAGHTRLLGSRSGSSFPRNDYGIVRYRSASPVPPGSVALGGGRSQDISTSGAPRVGQVVRRSGSTTGVHDGLVTQLGVTVVYPEGTVRGLARTTLCAESGDSGGPVFAGTVALGLVSGGSGDCVRGGTTFVQPVGEALQAYGARVY